MTTAIKKSGLVEFKSQKEIFADRQRKTEESYRQLRLRVNSLKKESYQLVHESVAKTKTN